MIEGKYLVMWRINKRIQKKGFWNSIFGKKMLRTEQVIHSYGSEEIAECGFKNLKSNGCMKPLLLKVLKD